jgi:hypothetical protein
MRIDGHLTTTQFLNLMTRTSFSIEKVEGVTDLNKQKRMSPMSPMSPMMKKKKKRSWKLSGRKRNQWRCKVNSTCLIFGRHYFDLKTG